MIKITTMAALICFLTLSLASAPALACNQQNQGITRVTVQTKEIYSVNLDDYPFPVSFQANAIGQQKALVGVGTFTHIFPDSSFDSKILLSGSIKCNTITLIGKVVKSDQVPYMLGATIKFVADTGCKHGDATLTVIFPKVEGSPLSGTIFVFKGDAKVSIY
jgi:hypothetical protein